MNLGRVGGLLEAKKIAGMAEAHYAQIAPHLYCGPIVGAANIQLATCSSELPDPGEHRALGRLSCRAPQDADPMGGRLRDPADRHRASASNSTKRSRSPILTRARDLHLVPDLRSGPPRAMRFRQEGIAPALRVHRPRQSRASSGGEPAARGVRPDRPRSSIAPRRRAAGRGRQMGATIPQAVAEQVDAVITCLPSSGRLDAGAGGPARHPGRPQAGRHLDRNEHQRRGGDAADGGARRRRGRRDAGGAR